MNFFGMLPFTNNGRWTLGVEISSIATCVSSETVVILLSASTKKQRNELSETDVDKLSLIDIIPYFEINKFNISKSWDCRTDSWTVKVLQVTCTVSQKRTERRRKRGKYLPKLAKSSLKPRFQHNIENQW